AARDAGLRRAVVSSSTNCKDVLEAAGIADLLEVRIDGTVAEREHLHGKPAPDTFLAAARALDVEPAQAAVYEDALAGVEAGRAPTSTASTRSGRFPTRSPPTAIRRQGRRWST